MKSKISESTMNVVISGSSGFIGRYLIEELNLYKSKYRIILISNNVSDHFDVLNHNNYSISKMEFDKLNLNNIDYFIHLGAFTPKSNHEANDILKNTNNINSTINLLNSFMTPPKNLIYISTIDVYKRVDTIINEQTLTQPKSLYGHSKLYSEKIIEEYASKNGSNFQILRLGHIYGSGEDEYKKLIPASIIALSTGDIPVVYNDGIQKVSYLHVKDCVRCIVKSMTLRSFTGPINIVSNQFKSVKEVVELIMKLSGFKTEIKNIISDTNFTDFRFDNSKMVQNLCSESEDFVSRLNEEVISILGSKNEI